MNTTTMRRLATGTALTALATTLLAGAATAETTTFKDARGDLDHGADITRVRVVNEDRVKVRVVHRDLVRSYESGSSMAIFFDTDRSRKGPEFVFQGATFEGADYALLRAKGWKPKSRQAVPLRCGYDMALNYARDTATVRLDRACLGYPGRIRVEVKTGGTGDEPATSGVDWLGTPRTFTPWVTRG